MTISATQTNSINQLSDKLLTSIFSLTAKAPVESKNLCHIGEVCKKWYNLHKENALWNPLITALNLEKHAQIIAQNDSTQNIKAVFAATIQENGQLTKKIVQALRDQEKF